MTAVGARVARRGRFWAGFRCAEPVVVLESDDWGLRRAPVAERVAPWGRPTGWADEHTETAADLDRLFDALAAHVDPEGRPAALTMNVVTANPDHDAIEADGFRAYHDRPIDQTLPPEVVDRYRRGVDEGLAALELHGRSHLLVDRWLADLRADHPGARALFADRVDGGLSLVAEEAWRYHSELVDWSSGTDRPVAELVTWLRPAVETVTRLAGRPPRSVVGPHYVVTDGAEAAWARLGLEFLQAADRRLAPGRPPAASYLSQPGRHGLVHLTRTARFDPRPARTGHHVDQTATVLRRCFDQGLPAVIDTHRINFTGPWAADAVAELDALLAVADAAGARYLTTPELGDAVRNGGRFTDRAGADRGLRPVGGTARGLVRPLLGRP